MKTIQNLTNDHQLISTGFFASKARLILQFVLLFSFVVMSSTALAQLGVYAFTGANSCPTQNPNVTSQPTNAVFSNFSTVNADCKDEDNVCNHEEWNENNTIDLNEYHQFTITANVNHVLNLTSFSFRQFIKDEDNLTTQWILRSSIDNYTTNIGTGLALEATQTPTVVLPAANFTGVSTVTFRIYLINSKDDSNEWTIDDVTLNGSVLSAPATPANPTSDSPQCSNPGVTLTASGTPPAGETWYWQTSANGTNTANAGSTYTVTSSGTYYIRSLDNTTLAWSSGAGSLTVIVTDVSTPVFTLGANTNRCLGASTINYTASATYATGITYSLDALSLLGGNTIDGSTGDVTYDALWAGNSIITATATGCNGPTTATHTVTVNPSVGTPTFILGVSSSRCRGAGTVIYTASATNSSGITYSLDAASIAGGNSINSSTGAVVYTAIWSGTSTITATATGCNGPASATHTVTTNLPVSNPVFILGASSTRCLGAAVMTYTATATNTTGITYSLSAAAIAGGNSINASTGAVTYAAGWAGATIITARAAGCAGPRTAAHTVTVTPNVGLPIFLLGAGSTRCEGVGTITYTATATNNTGITYSLDAASIAAGNSIDPSTGAVTYVAGWTTTSTITASASGCNGPRTSNHTVTISPTVGIPVFTWGASSTRCQAGGIVNYTAAATNNTGMVYTLDAASIAGGNTITAAGQLNYSAAWTGMSIITATASGCNGPASATHTVTINPLVSIPVFTLGATSNRCQGAGTVTYTASATNTTGITYSLNAAAIAGGNSINSSTGDVTYAAGWTGATIITASAAGCTPRIATHIVTITPTVGTPVFTLGPNSTRCQGAGTVNYTASASNNTSITYSLDAASLAGGNTINSSTGAVTYIAGWTGISTIAASAAGCNGPRNASHIVTTRSSVGTPVFTLGASSTRCQGTGIVTYTATATNATGITYALDAASIAGGNTVNLATGAITYAAGWSGTSTITASAAGCNGPGTSTHTVTITPTVGIPVFSLGASSTRCQGAGAVTYTASATTTTGITYSLDAPSLAGGNTINSATGVVTFSAGWSGTSTVTARAAGCSGPRSSTHTVTTTASVGSPVFSLGPVSNRVQGPGTETYDASATNTTGITYSLDAASIAGGNSINTATGEVTYVAGWNNTTTITATAVGCGSPTTATHIVTMNLNSVIKQLYLSDPAQALDRVDPVNTGDATTANSPILSTAGTTFTTFTMAPALCDALTIKAGSIIVRNYLTISSGAMPANPDITAVLQYGATVILTLTNPTYNSGTNLLTWSSSLPADVTVPAGEAIALQIITAEPGVNFRIDFDSQTKPSRIDLPVSTFINITNLDVYNATYPAGIPVTTAVGGTIKYIRATVTDPFGFSDITGMNIVITPTGSTVAATSVATAGCTRIYEYVWTTPVISGTYGISATAREGFENSVTNTRDISFDICATCAPIALNDSITGAGGTPIIMDVLANDNDPNNNINPASLAIVIQPKNGSAYISNNTIVYLPNGTFQGRDTLTYRICDLTSPSPLCATAQVFFTIDPLIVNICADAGKSHTYYIPYPEDQSYIALLASSNVAMPSNNIRTVISIKVPYSGMTIVWDEWEDGYEASAVNPTQATTKVWGDGDPFNGIAPGYGSDIIPAGASIVLDNTMNANPRNPATVRYDGKDKIVSSGQIAMTQVSGEPARMSVQAIKTNITSTFDFGQSFTIPLGQDFNSRDFMYTALFIRASQNNTTINIDRDNNGTFEATTILNEGGSYFINGGVLTGATVASDKPIGVEVSSGGVDNFSIRNAPIFPATWYSSTYYTPVPTSDIAANNPKDTSVVMLYNSLNRSIDINWYSGAPANGVITVPAKSVIRFPLAYSATATYKFENLTGESFTAIEIVDSYTPGGGGNGGMEYDWAFNLISELRLTDFATVAWAPGSIDGSRNDNPIWVTPTMNTTVYVKYDGDVSNGASTSPCGLKYDIAIPLNALNYTKIRDLSDNSQSGTAVYTCNGAKIAAVYGEDPATAVVANPSWDVGATIQPFCKQKLVIATDDYATTLVSQPVTISVLNNDFGFLGIVDPSTVTTTGLLQPKHGTTTVNSEGSVQFIPAAGYSGLDTFEYRVCSTPSPVVCDVAMVVVNISTCPSNGNQNIISGQVFIDRNKDAINNDGGTGLAPVKVYLYTDGNCSGTINSNELTDSVTVDSSGFYQFTKYPEKTVEDNFDNGSGGRTCANGTDGDSPWASDWVDAGDPSGGFCNNSQPAVDTDADIFRDGAFGYGLRLKDNNVSVTRTVNLNGATKAFLTFSYRRKSSTLSPGEIIYVQASNGGAYTTIYTIAGNGASDATYTTVYNQDITSYASATTGIRFLTNNSVDDADTVYIDNVSVKYLRYPQCYITSIAASSIPANYSITTAGQKTITINSGGSCTSQFDFGFGKPNVTVSGTLYNDKDGLVDGQVDGVPYGSPGGAILYAYLSDISGNVAFKTLVNSVDGTYSFPLAEINTDYTLILSTTDVPLGVAPPTSLNCYVIWKSVGDAYGTNNLAGSGNKAGTSNTSIAVRTGVTNVTNVNFGLQRVPDSDNYLRSINQPDLNQYIALDGQGLNPPVLSGTDPEDCTGGCLLTARNVIIDTVPSNAELYYNNSLVSNGQMITNLDPSVLLVRVTSATLGDTTIRFRYSYVDSAIMKDPTPATYGLAWLIPLPADRLTAMVNLSGTEATIKWTTLSEQNTNYYVVERSLDNRNFRSIGNKVSAAGNSVVKSDYQLPDNIASLMQNNVIYYRVKLVDLDGKLSFSNTVSVRLSQKRGLTVWPNPFKSYITISISTDRETNLDIKLIDVNGRNIRSISQPAAKGVSMITVTDIDQLPAGMYLVEITDKIAGTTFQKLLKNN